MILLWKLVIVMDMLLVDINPLMIPLLRQMPVELMLYGLTSGTDPGLEYNITVELVNVTGNSWTISHTGGDSTSLGSVIHGGGSISLTNALDRLRIKTKMVEP